MDNDADDVGATGMDGAAVEMRLLAPVHLSDRTTPGEVVLRCTTEDPHAVSAVIDTGQGAVSWLFDRSLLTDGLNGPTGEGRVTSMPARDGSGRRFLVVYFQGESGSMRVDLDAGPVRMFLDVSSRHVQPESCADLLAAEIEAFLTD
jgi:hypothetical protein